MVATFILGGARSGKSARALALAEAAGTPRLYLATAEARDDEMRDRIARHRAERGDGWTTREVPLLLADALSEPGVMLVDCLTLWLSNLFEADLNVEDETSRLVSALRQRSAPTILVSNEIGLGLVPETPLGRAFRDAQGRLNQRIAAACDVVEFVAAGLPLRLKG